MTDQKDDFNPVLIEVYSKMRNMEHAQSVCFEDELIASYLDNKMSDPEIHAFESHLAECSVCTEKVILLSELINQTQTTSDTLISNEMINDIKKKQTAEPTETEPSEADTLPDYSIKGYQLEEQAVPLFKRTSSVQKETESKSFLRKIISWISSMFN